MFAEGSRAISTNFCCKFPLQSTGFGLSRANMNTHSKIYIQQCGSRAGDAVVGYPKLLNGLCRRAMQTEEPMVIDALTALSHQNDKMLWIVTTIIKVMRVEKNSDIGLLGRTVASWKNWRRIDSKARTKNMLLQVAVAPKSSRTFISEPSSQKMGDVDGYYSQTDTRPYPSVVTTAVHTQRSVNRIRDDIIIEPCVQSVSSTMQSTSASVRAQPSSIYSSWNASSTPLYSTWNATSEMPSRELSSASYFGFVPKEDRLDIHSTSSSLSLPSSTGTFSTFSSIKVNTEDDKNPSMSVTGKLTYRSHQLRSEVDSLRTNRTLPEARVLPERPWISSEDESRQEFHNTMQLTVPPDSLLFASRSNNAAPSLCASWNASSSMTVQQSVVHVEQRAQHLLVQPTSFAWKGAEFNVASGPDHMNALPVYHSQATGPRHHPEVFDEQILRAQAFQPAPVQHARTPSAPPRLVSTEAPSTLMPETTSGKQSLRNTAHAPVAPCSIGASVSRAISTTTPSARALSPPRTLPAPHYVEPERESFAATIQEPIRKAAAPGSICDVEVDHLLDYFSRGRTITRDVRTGEARPAQERIEIRSSLHPTVRISSPMCAAALLRMLPSKRVVSSDGCEASPQRTTSVRRDAEKFHKIADDFAFQRNARGLSPSSGRSPPRSSPPGARSMSPPPTRSIVGASTIQFANTTTFAAAPPQTAPMPRQKSPLRRPVEMCDVDETRMQPTFVGFTGPRLSASDWVQAPPCYERGMQYAPPQSPVSAGFNRVYVPADASPVSSMYISMTSGHVAVDEDDDDWC